LDRATDAVHLDHRQRLTHARDVPFATHFPEGHRPPGRNLAYVGAVDADLQVLGVADQGPRQVEAEIVHVLDFDAANAVADLGLDARGQAGVLHGFDACPVGAVVAQPVGPVDHQLRIAVANLLAHPRPAVGLQL